MAKMMGANMKNKVFFMLMLFLLSLLGVLLQFSRFQHSEGGNKPLQLVASMVPLEPLESMVISLDYWEQSGSALASLYNLQCWASSLGIAKVVEPDVVFGTNSVFRFSDFSGATFKDYYDIDHWNRRSLEHGNAVLVPWANFFNHSYRDIVYVQILFPLKKCEPIDKLPHIKWFIPFGFKFTTICVPANISDNALRKSIFSRDRKPHHNVSVIIKEWRGISSSRTFRLRLQGTKCGAGYSYVRTKQFRAPVSTVKVSNKIEEYLKSFVRDIVQGSSYIVVMLRNERLDKYLYSSNKTEDLCLKDIVSDHKKASVFAQTSTTVLFSDSSSHGSSALYDRRIRAEIFTKRVVNSIKPLYPPDKMDDILEKITDSTDSILMTLLQSTIASNAKGLVLVGGGSFQMMTLNRYMEISEGMNNYFFRNKTCHYIPNFNNPR